MEKEILSVRINNIKPLRLLDFTTTVLGVSNIYKIWAKQNILEKIEYDLYIEELREGSKIVDFITKQSIKLFKDVSFKFFASFYKEQIQNLLQEKYEHMDKKQISAIQQSVSSNKNDLNSNFQITAKENNIVQNTFNISGIEASAIDKICTDVLKNDNNKYEKIEGVLLMLKQAENSEKTKKIDKGIIEDISEKTMSIIYNENIKREIIMDKDNFFKMWFLVDVYIKRANEKIVAYQVIKLHTKGEL